MARVLRAELRMFVDKLPDEDAPIPDLKQFPLLPIIGANGVRLGTMEAVEMVLEPAISSVLIHYAVDMIDMAGEEDAEREALD